MPIYEYRCEKGHAFEVMQRMADDPIAECTVCGRAVQRVFHPVAVHFKGSGFYNTDYGKRGAKKDGAESESTGDSDGKKSSDSSSSDSKKSSSSDSKKSSSDSKKTSAASKS